MVGGRSRGAPGVLGLGRWLEVLADVPRSRESVTCEEN